MSQIFVFASVCLSVLCLIQCLCASHVTNWLSPFFPSLCLNTASRTLPLVTLLLAAPVSKRSTVHCMECATVCRLYGGRI